MAIRWYRLENRVPVPAEAGWKTSYNAEEWRVGRTTVGDATVSTVFLALDHNMTDDGPPLLFETMVFRADVGDECWRCSTWEEAERQHAEVVAMLEERQHTEAR